MMLKLDKVMFFFAILVIVGICFFGMYDTGTERGALRPIKYTKTVEFDKVIGWCVLSSLEDATEAGLPDSYLKENLPDLREVCEDRWLAYSKRWERGETK
jgi:hypothetical protein